MDSSIEKYMLKCETGSGDVTAIVRKIDTDYEDVYYVVGIMFDFLKAVGYCDVSIKKAFNEYGDEQNEAIQEQTINEYYDAFGNFCPRRAN